MSQLPSQDPGPADHSSSDLPPRRVPWTFPDSLFVLGIWILFLAVFAGFLIYPLLLQVTDAETAQAVQLPISSALLVLVSMAYVNRRYPGAALRLFGERRINLADVGLGVLAGIVALGVFALGLGWVLEKLAETLKQELPTVQEEFKQLAGNPRTVPFLILGAGIIAPIAEEVLYRGMMFAALRKRLPVWPAAGISGLLFGITHFETTLEGYLLVLLVVTPLGMFLALLYEWRRTLFVPILAHAVFNLPQVAQLVSDASPG